MAVRPENRGHTFWYKLAALFAAIAVAALVVRITLSESDPLWAVNALSTFFGLMAVTFFGRGIAASRKDSNH
jgi:hypothetical protein